MNSPLLLNLAHWLPASRANGPGQRMSLWVQGCPFRCSGCQNPDFLDFRLNKVVTVDQVWDTFLKIPNLDGVSFSGGEPFAQAVALGELASRVREAGKSVVCWTGYRLGQLQTSDILGSEKLINNVDLLIDGLFVFEQRGNLVLRGSNNQQLHFLSNRIQKNDLEHIPRQEWFVTEDNLTYTGFPTGV